MSHDTSILEEIIPGHIDRLCNVHKEGRRLLTPVLQVWCPIAKLIWASQEIPQLDFTADNTFWTLLSNDGFGREMKWGESPNFWGAINLSL